MASYKEERARVQGKATRKDRTLRSNDARFKGGVYVRTEDGSTLMYRGSFYVEDGKWYVVFGEHIRPHVFAREEVEEIRTLGDEWFKYDLLLAKRVK